MERVTELAPRFFVYIFLNAEFMEKKEKEQKEQILNRREFFKDLGKKVLPVLGAIAIASTPLKVMAKPTEAGGCLFWCSGSCSGTCEGTCTNFCSQVCEKWCNGKCVNGCKGCTSSCASYCAGGCHDSCINGCTGTCLANCRNYTY